MNRKERILKYINSSDDFVVNGKRYCENDFYNDVEDLAKENQELKKELEEKNKHQIFIDTKDIEERYGEQLYQDYLVEQNKDLKQENKQLKEHIEKYEHYCKTTGIEELMKENKKYKEVIDKIKTRYIDYYGITKEVNDDYVLRSVLKEISDLLKEVE